jgi:hypothetical protein
VLGGSAGGGACSTTGGVGVLGAANAVPVTAAMGAAISTPATANFLMVLPMPEVIVQVIDYSLHGAAKLILPLSVSLGDAYLLHVFIATHGLFMAQ